MTLVVSQRSLVPVGVKSSPTASVDRSRRMQGRRSVELIGLDYAESYSSIYSSQPWIYAVVNKLARGMARLPLKSFAKDSATNEREPIRNHPLPVLISRPYPRGSRFKLTEKTMQQLAIYGNALWWKYRQRPGQPPVELWPIDWRYVSIEAYTAGSDPIVFFEYRGPLGQRIFFPDEVVHFQWESPAGPLGTSPLEPLRTTLALEDAGRRYAASSFSNGVRPSGALIHPKKLDEGDKTDLRAEIQGTHANPDQAFRMLLLDGGLDWKPFSHTAQEAQTIEHRKLNREEACAVYDLPPPVLQILDRATFSNIDEQHRMLYQDSFAPWTALVEDTVDCQLLWGETALALDAGRDTFVEYDFGEVLKPEITKRFAAYAASRTAGVTTANELRDKENLPRIADPLANAILIPLNMRPVGEGVEWEAPDPAAVESASLDQLRGELDAMRRELADLPASLRA